MATNTYVALDKATVSGTSTTSVTLSGISGSYTDLRLVINSQNQNNTYQPYIQFNADTSTGSTNYSTTSIRGDGSSAASSRHTNQNGWYPVPGPGVGTTGNFQPCLVDIMNYSNTTTNKSGISRFNNSASVVAANIHLWRSTAAITSITITAESGAGYLVAGSTFSLYGIKAETVPTAKATGGTIAYGVDGYTYHTFTAGGTFTPTQSLTCELLLVGGGASGAAVYAEAAGGGGAGQVKLVTGVSASATGYTVVVGGGGSGTTSTTGNLGTSSSVLSQSATTATSNASSFDGGASGNSFAGGGNNGITGGGGGGAGAVGAAGTGGYSSGTGGAGGAGLNTYSTWASVTSTGSSGYYGGGGGGGGRASGDNGGPGGAGGGGKGGSYQSGYAAIAGTANTGGGGGGRASSSGSSGAGGSGLVIIRYVSA